MGFFDWLDEPQTPGTFGAYDPNQPQQTPGTFGAYNPAAPQQTPGTFGTIGSTTPSTSAVQAQTDQVQQQAFGILNDAGIATGTTPYTVDQLLQQFAAAGADINNGDVQTVAAGLATLPQDQQNQYIVPSANAMASAHPAPTSSYEQTKQALGLDAYQFPETVTPSESQVEAGLKAGRTTGQPVPAAQKSRQYAMVNGVFYWKNGVIASPGGGGSSPSIMYDPNRGNVPGSPGWMIHIQKTWTTEQAQNWRTQLNKLGYGLAKKGGMDQNLLAATQAYYQSKYLNGGNITPVDSKGAGTGGPTRTPPLDLHQLQASIQNQVQQQYQSIFGQDPKPAELQSWTQFIINTGMQLQQGGPRQSLSPDAALSEAEARAARQITTSPAGSTWIQNQQENTSLHDALTSAIAATRGLA